MAALAIAIVAIAFAVPPVSAAADVACSFGGTSGPAAGTVAVDMRAAGDSATIAVAGGEIVLDGRQCAAQGLLGPAATTRNTDAVFVRDVSGGATEFRVADPAAFAPGVANEGDGSAEIELGVDLGPGPGDVLRLDAAGADVRDRFVLGTEGGVQAANLNASTEQPRSADADLAIAGVELVTADGRALDDRIDAGGDAELEAPLAIDVELFGADGEDELGGGDGADLLHGGAGDDLLAGGAGRDVLLGEGEEDVLAGGEGPDRLDGGLDDDLADYRVPPEGSSRGVRADLRGGTVGGGGGGDRLIAVEGLLGSPLADTVIGSGAMNFVDGGAGADRLEGGAETDALFGSAGADSLLGGGARDVLFGGAGDDLIEGELGKDIVVAGSGADRIGTERGVDVVDASGGGRDVVDCGPGRDGYDADRADRVRSCEVRLEIT